MSIYKIEKQISKYIETMSNRFQILNTLTKSLLNENTNIPRLNISMIFSV